jgi:hypothetical protein
MSDSDSNKPSAGHEADYIDMIFNELKALVNNKGRKSLHAYVPGFQRSVKIESGSSRMTSPVNSHGRVSDVSLWHRACGEPSRIMCVL